MKYSIDGGVTFLEALEGVRVIIDDVLPEGESRLLLNMTHEGLILDLEGEHPEIGGMTLGTSSQMYSDMVADLLDGG